MYRMFKDWRGIRGDAGESGIVEEEFHKWFQNYVCANNLLIN